MEMAQFQTERELARRESAEISLTTHDRQPVPKVPDEDSELRDGGYHGQHFATGLDRAAVSSRNKRHRSECGETAMRHPIERA